MGQNLEFTIQKGLEIYRKHPVFRVLRQLIIFELSKTGNDNWLYPSERMLRVKPAKNKLLNPHSVLNFFTFSRVVEKDEVSEFIVVVEIIS